VSSGRRNLIIVAVAGVTTFILARAGEAPARSDEQAVRAVENQFRMAKLKNDVALLDRIVAPEYLGINQNGNQRDKAQLLKLFADFPMSTIAVASTRVIIAGDTALVTGAQDERVCNPDHLLFSRVYLKRDGQWRLLSNVQFRDPKAQPSPP
jgi:hypothetical protein